MVWEATTERILSPMRNNLRVLALCLFGGVLASVGFIGTTAIADSFTDVAPSSFFAEDIDWLTDYDIATGFPDGTFDPRGNLRRQQAALWMRNLSSEFELVSDTVNPTTASSFTRAAVCPGDKRAVAGGGTTDAFNVLMAESHPVPGGGGWRVRWETKSGANLNPSSVTVYALCVPRL